MRRSKQTRVFTLESLFVWISGNMVYQYESLTPTQGTVYIYGINLISSRNNSGFDKFYLYNAHGDVVQLVNSSGTVVQEYQYDAFGVEYNPDANDTNYFRYTGQYFDTESGTYYLRARYYNPANGRFTQQDGWGYGDINDPLSLNLYAYCHNSPLMYFDFSGHSPWYAFLITHEWGYMHKAVEKYIVENYNKVSNEVRVERTDEAIKNGYTKNGYMDIYSSETNTVWEIKHSEKNTTKAYDQANSYVGSTIKGTDTVVNGLGESNAFTGTFDVNYMSTDYTVTFETPAPGVIIYTFDYKEEEKNPNTKVIADPKAKEKDEDKSAGLPIIIIPAPVPSYGYGIAAASGGGMPVSYNGGSGGIRFGTEY